MKKAALLGIFVLVFSANAQAANYAFQCQWNEPSAAIVGAETDVEFIAVMEPLPANNYDRLAVVGNFVTAGSATGSGVSGVALFTIDTQNCGYLNTALVCITDSFSQCTPTNLEIDDFDNDGNDDVLVTIKKNSGGGVVEETIAYNGLLQVKNGYLTTAGNENDVPVSEKDHLILTDFNHDGLKDSIRVQVTGPGTIPNSILLERQL